MDFVYDSDEARMPVRIWFSYTELQNDLEVVDEDGNVKKADMFYKQTIRAKNQVDRVETATEALNVSVSEFGVVNIPFMLSIYEADISKAMAELPEGSPLSEQAEAELKRGI